jgi:putative RecB family exonuclease
MSSHSPFADGSDVLVGAATGPCLTGEAPGWQMPNRFSPSALTRFRVCNRQFQLIDLERVGAPEQPNPLFAQGNAIHAALEYFFGLPPKQRTPAGETLQNALRERWRRDWDREALPDRDLEIELGQKGLRLLAGFAEHFDTTVQPLARERWVKVTLPNGVELFGRVDRIDPFEDGLSIVDYKSGRRNLDQDDLRDEPAAQVYLLATQAIFRRPVHRIRFYYLESQDEISWWPEQEDIPALIEKLTNLTDTIRAATDFPAAPGDDCRWCPVARNCDDRKATSPAI